MKAYYDRVCREELERLTSTEVECMTNSEGLRYYNRVCRLELERLTSTEVKCMTNSEGLHCKVPLCNFETFISVL